MDAATNRWGWIYGTLLLCAGCEALEQKGFPHPFPMFDDNGADARQEETHREKFLRSRNAESLRWLLGHRIEVGMTVSEVQDVLGEPGERIYDDARFKSGGGPYHQNDEFYRWGPDGNGRSYYLGFRDGTLVGFDPREYR